MADLKDDFTEWLIRGPGESQLGYMAEQREKLMVKLIDGALGVLHHDRSEGTDVDRYEREQLRKVFDQAFSECRWI